MESQFGFTKYNLEEFSTWLDETDFERDILYILEHHTAVPAYSGFDGLNHFNLQQGMQTYHVETNGWSDIGQQLTIFPDGMILTGRSFETNPACIAGKNTGSVCIENLGNFDTGEDEMNTAQRDSIIAVTGMLCKKFNIEANSDNILYHHWYDLNTHLRTNGTGTTKSCPGTNFFGGNSVANAEENFIPLVQAYIDNNATNETNNTTNRVKVRIVKDKKTQVPLKIKDNVITHIGVYPRKNPLGWSRMYMHLWKIGQKQLAIPADQVEARLNDIEQWVLDTLHIIKQYSNRINPDVINYNDLKDILIHENRVNASAIIPYDSNLKHETYSNDDFYTHSKYGETKQDASGNTVDNLFKKTIPALDGGFTGWWKKLNGEELVEPSEISQSDNGQSDEDDNDQTHYGGYLLKFGDKDSEKKWGGTVRTDSAKHVEDLQKDLVRLGYWISDPTNSTYNGMKVDGEFKEDLKRAVMNFQFEYYLIQSDGTINSSEKDKITGIVNEDTAKGIKKDISNISSEWPKRRSHKAIITFTYNGQSMTNDSGQFYQLVPSKGYTKYSIDYEKSDEITIGNFVSAVWKPYKGYVNSDFKSIMADCWGKKETIKLIKEVGDIWASEKVQHPTTSENTNVGDFCVGDISPINGGPIPGHANGVNAKYSHNIGTAADISGYPANMVNFRTPFDRECARRLAELFQASGAKRILFNCHYVINNCNIVEQLEGHHNHMHVYSSAWTGTLIAANRHTSCHGCPIYNECQLKITTIVNRTSGEEEAYNPNGDPNTANSPYVSRGTTGVVRLSDVVA